MFILFLEYNYHADRELGGGALNVFEKVAASHKETQSRRKCVCVSKH